MDYYHYKYECPYLTSAEANRVHCEGGCRVGFSCLADCKRWVQRYCASEPGWKDCTIAQMQTDHIERMIKLRRSIQEWKDEMKQKR